MTLECLHSQVLLLGDPNQRALVGTRHCAEWLCSFTTMPSDEAGNNILPSPFQVLPIHNLGHEL